MTRSETTLAKIQTGVLLTALSALLWVAFWFFNKFTLSGTLVTTGVNLVYIPAGIRLLMVLLFGFWGALGVALSDPILFLNEFGSGAPAEIIVNSVISGFGPYLVLKAVTRLSRISADLSGLAGWHLPFLALAVSLLVPLLLSLHFLLNGRAPIAEFPRNYCAMVAGDFLGCLLVIACARALIVGLRSIEASRRG